MATASRPLPPVRAINPSPKITPCAISNCCYVSLAFCRCGKLVIGDRTNWPLQAAPAGFPGGTSAVLEIDESQFSDVVLKSKLPVLVEFVAVWCGPCRLIAPAVQSIAEGYQEKLVVVKVDHDSNPRLIAEYKVYGLPTLIAFQNGVEMPESRREGAITKAKLKEYVDQLLLSTPSSKT